MISYSNRSNPDGHAALTIALGSPTAGEGDPSAGRARSLGRLIGVEPAPVLDQLVPTESSPLYNERQGTRRDIAIQQTHRIDENTHLSAAVCCMEVGRLVASTSRTCGALRRQTDRTGGTGTDQAGVTVLRNPGMGCGATDMLHYAAISIILLLWFEQSRFEMSPPRRGMSWRPGPP